MYNLDAYIADFLADHKKLSAQGIGEFTIVDGQASNGAPLVNFVSNKAAHTSDDLISFIAEHQGKNKIVTGFDVESHFNQVKQFINIGTPWSIPGFGQVKLGKSREMEFVQEVQNENALHERIKHKQAATEANYQTYDGVQKGSNTGTVMLTLLIILALGAGGYYFYTHNKNPAAATATKDTAATVTDTVVAVPSSSNINNTVTNTQPPTVSAITKPADTIKTNAISSSPTATTSSNASGFRFVLNTTTNAEYAHKRYLQLKAYGTSVFIDSVKRDSGSVYKIYLLNHASPADTAKLRDSLTRYYGKPVKIESGH